MNRAPFIRIAGIVFSIIAWTGFSLVNAATEKDELSVKRERIFEFARNPRISQNGDTVTIQFETKAFCDVTIAVESNGGKIVRHLASGVLGPNAPKPFQRKSKAQTLVWDGKDDQGRYINKKAAYRVRVSLGLKPKFEKALF